MKILTNEVAKLYQISSLQRGHLIFTSFISFNGKILFFEDHIDRLVKGAAFLFPNVGWEQNKEKIKQYVESFIKSFEGASIDNSYFRLTLFDENLHLEQRPFEIHSDTLLLMSALKVKTAGLIPSFVKLSNYLESDLELIRAKFKNYDDVLFFDNNGNTTESSTSNILIVNEHGHLISPAPSSLILDGITRKNLLEKLRIIGYNVSEAPVSKIDIERAREVWLTNSIKGVRFVLQFEDIVYQKNNSIYIKAIESFGRYGELV